MNVYSISPLLTGTTTGLMLQPNMVSGSRGQMQGAHYQQAPQVVGCEQRTLFTGLEQEYGKWMFNVVVEDDCYVDQVIERKARSTIGDYDVLETQIFVKLAENSRLIDVITVPRYISNHQYFGFDLEIAPEVRRKLRKGQFLPKGLVIAQCKSVIEDEWCVGVQANTILVSHPQMIEDACKISDRLGDKLLSYGYKTFRMFVGDKEYPLYLYGDEENPRILPAVGEKVRRDGILMGKRAYDDILCALQMSDRSLREPCGHFDILTNTDREAVVHDIRVFRDEMKVTKKDELTGFHNRMRTPVKMQKELDEYVGGLSHSFKQVRDYYRSLKVSTKYNMVLRPRCSQAIREAIEDAPLEFDSLKETGIRKKQFNNELLDDYMIEITVKYPIPIDASGKLTDCAGGKGIVGERARTEDMPVDDYGNIVDIMMADNATLRRTNYNRPFECYINAARRDCQIRAMEMYNNNDPQGAWDYILGFCDIVSPPWADIVRRAYGETEEKMFKFLDLLNTGTKLRIWIPHNLAKDADVIEKEVEDNYPPRRSKLTFKGPNGETIRTENEFIVGELYIIRLDKTGREMSAISAGRFQHFGTISKQHPGDKNRRQIREHPIKFMGESEGRHMGAYIGGDVCADIHDKANNPIVADVVTYNIIEAPVPTNIVEVVDRIKYPLGHNRSMEMVHHILSCEGVCFTDRRKGDVRMSEFEIK